MTVITELKALRLHGMAATWAELGEQNNAELERSRWALAPGLQRGVLGGMRVDDALRQRAHLGIGAVLQLERERPAAPL